MQNEKMKGVIYEKYGNASVLQLKDDLAIPTITKDSEVLIEVHSASINPIDSIIRNGYFHSFMPVTFPSKIGYDLAGVVTDVKPENKKFKKGDKVFARIPEGYKGSLAEFNVCDDAFVALKPENLTYEEAASIPLVAETVYQAFIKANFQKGQKVFISGGAGGAGSFALQYAKHILGASVVATTTSDTKIDLCKSLGADVVVNYRKDDFTTILSGFDFALDLTHESLKCLKVLSKKGLCLSLNQQPSPELQKECETLDVSFGSFMLTPSGEDLTEIAKFYEQGKVKTLIDKIYDLKEFQKAFEHLDGGRSTGKVVVKIK